MENSFFTLCLQIKFAIIKLDIEHQFISSLESNLSKFHFRKYFQTSSFTHPRDPKHKGKSFTFQPFSLKIFNNAVQRSIFLREAYSKYKSKQTLISTIKHILETLFMTAISGFRCNSTDNE